MTALGTVTRRVQLRRIKGWRKPPGTVVVARPSKWGNPWDTAEEFANGLIELSESHLPACDYWVMLGGLSGIRRELGGKDLACWCPLNRPCHADVLLCIAASADGGFEHYEWHDQCEKYWDTLNLASIR